MFAESKIEMPLVGDVEDSTVSIARPYFRVSVAPESVSVGSLLTMVLWGGVILVGLIGFMVEPVRPVAALVQPPPVQAELLAVELSNEPVVLPSEAPVNPVEPPPLLDPLIPPPEVTMTQVAAPDAIVAFAMPVEGPVRIVETAQASHTRAVVEEAPAPVVAGPPVQKIVYGRGEGKQEKPEYPRQAKRERQEGAVGVKFSVGPNGRVLEAALSSPSPWPLLNEAALNVIRNRWRFRTGDVRVYEVFIRFELTR